MAVPTKRHTKSARNQRRAGKNLAQPAISICAMCKSPKKPHHICGVCGVYKKRKVLDKKKPTKTSTQSTKKS